MLKLLVASCVVITILSMPPRPAFAQRQSNPAQDRDSIANGWRFDYAAAREEAVRVKKPMMVVMRCVP